MHKLHSTLSGIGTLARRRLGIAGLFATGDTGAWFDISDRSSLFQDAAGTIPVVAAGDPVGLVLDKTGRGQNLAQPVAANRPLYQIDPEGRPYLELNGTSHFMVGTMASALSSGDLTILAGFLATGPETSFGMVIFMGNSSGPSTNGDGVPHLGRQWLSSKFGQHDAWRSANGLTVDLGAEALDAPWVASLTRAGGTNGQNGQLTLRLNTSLTASALQSWQSDTTAQFTLGTQDTDFSSVGGWRGRIYGVAILGRAAGEAELMSAEAEMARRTGVS